MAANSNSVSNLARQASKQILDEFEKVGESAKQQVTGMEAVPTGGKPANQQASQSPGQKPGETQQLDAQMLKAQSTRRLQQLENEILEIRRKKEAEYRQRLEMEAAKKQQEAEEEAAKAEALNSKNPIGKLAQGITSRVDQMKKSTELGKRPTG